MDAPRVSGARRSRLLVLANTLPGATRRASKSPGANCAPSVPTAVPLSVIVPGALLTGRPAVMSATWVTSATPLRTPPGESVTTVRTVSPATMLGVDTNQQAPPGWFTSASPSSPTTIGALATVAPPRSAEWVTSKTTVSPGVSPSSETKSRAGNAVRACGATGGSLTVVVAMGVAANAGA